MAEAQKNARQKAMEKQEKKWEEDDIDNALSLNQTTCVNGIFVILVFLSHFCQYVDTASIPYFQPYLFLRLYLGQLIVTPFLFYSGYGIMEQIKAKGNKYVNDIPQKRVLKTWIHFAMAIVLFLFVSFIIGEHYPLIQIILSFFAWESIGNSNWYIFGILFMYIATYIGFKYLSNRKSLITVFLFGCLYIVTMHCFKDGSWWYDTILCYPAGVALSYEKENLKKYLKKYKVHISIICMFITVILYILKNYLIAHELLAIVFCLDIVLICTFINIENSVLLFLGKHTFEIYILQRIPMIMLKNRVGGYTYLLLSLIITIVMSVVFKKLERKVDLLLKL